MATHVRSVTWSPTHRPSPVASRALGFGSGALNSFVTFALWVGDVSPFIQKRYHSRSRDRTWLFNCKAIRKMKNCYKILIGAQFAVVAILGESLPHTYTGNIVNARCMQAAEIVSRNSRGYVPAGGVNAFTGARYNPLPTGRMRVTILRHCSVNPGVTEFALLEGGGNFFRLDEAGNAQVVALEIRSTKDTKVTIEGFVDGATLKVHSLAQHPVKYGRAASR